MCNKDHICKNGINDQWILFYGVSKYIDGIIVRQKTIEYSRDFFCCLSFLHFSLAFQAFIYSQLIISTVDFF